ncbi:DUF6519 domain-containing protein [Amycolatopsis anabasis]|uniref:DUF6519 domain-containing protein n=1 Tax=Amycolatopsis anabasis TaxID=1840409 RepID=UPI00131E1A42|nr:DUF6519 domain-containing protein [Amycolatopsis anabasis]
MKGDFSRLTNRAGQYSGVLLQQGRVQLDADANEQAAIQLALARRTAADVIGAHGGPADGFEIKYVPRSEKKDPASLEIRSGRYYVDGVLVDSARPAPPRPVDGPAPAQPGPWTYWDQPFAYLDPEREADALPDKFPFLVYLVAFEQFVTVLEDPALTETALGALLPDTAGRTRVAWQVRPLVLDGGNDPAAAFDKWVRDRRARTSYLAARTEKPARVEDDPCILSPDAAYRGPANQLYRVEVHRGGDAGKATVKWSRDNGSVAVGIRSVDGPWVTVASLGRDDKLALHVGDWTEVSDDAYAARGEVAPLLRVEEVDLPGRRVRLSAEPRPQVARHTSRHPLLRRWDHRAASGRGAPKLEEGAIRVAEDTWLDLEDGVQVRFQSGGSYVPGDYWLIPARTLIADVEWPRDSAGRPLLSPPHGVERHYAPLAWIRSATDIQHLRKTFKPLTG